MALQLTAQHNGVSIPNAYYKVIRVGGNKDFMEVALGVFATSEQTLPVFTYNFVMNPNTSGDAGDTNNIKQAYEYLKSAPVTMSGGQELDMTTAIDV